VPIQFVAPPAGFFPGSVYATFRSATTNPQMIAYPAYETTNDASATIITISNNNYAKNIVLFIPVSQTTHIILTDGSTYVLLMEDVNGVLCTQSFNNSTKIAVPGTTQVPVGATYNVGRYTLYNYGMNGAHSSSIPPSVAPCFVAGTQILTPTGYKMIEALQSGDRICTSDGRHVPIRLYSFTIDKATEDTAPFTIEAGALGNNQPTQDLHLSPRHAIQDMRGMWQIPRYMARMDLYAKHVAQYGIGESVTYYHIECPNFYRDNLIAEGAIVESYKHRQGTKGVVYIWESSLSGWQRIQSEHAMTVPTHSKKPMIFSY
jgi:hypothetical protein